MLKGNQRMETPINVETGPMDAVTIKRRSSNSYNKKKKKKKKKKRERLDIHKQKIKKGEKKGGGAYLQDEGSLSPRCKGQMYPC